MYNVPSCTITNLTGIFSDSNNLAFYIAVKNVIFDNLVLVGSDTTDLYFNQGASLIDVTFNGGRLNGHADVPSSYGIAIPLACITRNVVFNQTIIGAASGVYTDHSIDNIWSETSMLDITFYDCDLGAAGVLANVDRQGTTKALRFHKVGGTEGNDYTITNFGSLIHNASEGISGSDCLQLDPSGGSGNYIDTTELITIQSLFRAPAEDGVLRTVYIQLKDDASYNGANPSIALYMNGVLVDGWDACAVTTSYQEFSVAYTPTEDGILDLAIRCDGDAGNVYADAFRWA